MSILTFLTSGLVKSLVTVAVGVFKAVKGADEKPALTDLLTGMVTNLPGVVQNAVEYRGLDTLEKLDAWLALADSATGVEETAIDIIPDMPPELEEEFFDGLIKSARALGRSIILKKQAAAETV